MERLTFNVSARRGEAPQLVVGRRPLETPPAAASRIARVKERVRAAARERYDWDYIWMLTFTGLLFFRPQDHFPPLAALHLAELSAIAGLAAMAARRMASGQTLTKVNAEVVGVLGLGAVMVMTIPFSFWPGGSLAVFSDVFVKIILIFALMISTLTSPKRVYQTLWIIIVICGYVSVRGIYDYLRGVNLMEGNRLRGALGGFMENPNDLATNLIVFMGPALFIVFKDRGPLRRLVALGIVVVMAIAVVFTKSRAGFVGAAAMSVVIAYQMLRERPGVIFAIVFAGLIATPMMPNAFWDRMASITNPEEDQTGSREQRIQLLKQGMQVFAENPLTGVGAGQFDNYDGEMMVVRWRTTHNVWLQVAAELGIFGLLVFGFLVYRAFRACFVVGRALRPRRRRPKRAAPDMTLTESERRILDINAKGMLAGLVAWLVCSFFASLAFNWTFYYVFALAVAGREVVAARRLAPEPGARPVREWAPAARLAS